MSKETDDHGDDIRELTTHARIAFPLLAVVAFVCMSISMLAYARLGDTLTDGLDRACAEAQFEAGKKHEALGNTAQALRYFRQAMEGHFNDPQTRIFCGRSIGDALFRDGRYAEAIDAYEALPEESFTDSGAFTGYVEALRRNGQLDRAAELGETWISLAQAEANEEQTLWASNALMRIADAQGDDPTALKYARTIVDQQPGADARLLLARILHRQGKSGDAIRELDAFMEATQNTKLFAEARTLRDRIRPPQ